MKRFTLLSRAFILALLILLSINQVKATPLSVTVTSQTNVLCHGGNTGSATATATGGTAPYTYLWSTNPTQATATATGLSAGTYTVAVADASFATASAIVTISQPTLLVVTPKVLANVVCNGGPTGTIAVTVAGGISPYTYLWLPSGATDATASGMSAGCYTVSVVDNNHCSKDTSICITQPAALTAKVVQFSLILCNGGTGYLQGIVSGGTYPYTYNWSPGGSTSDTAMGLSAGCYTITVVDAKGCTASATGCLTQPAPLKITTLATPDFSGCNGTDTATVTGGTVPYTYLWSNGGTSIGINQLCAGTYCCKVTDTHGCIDTSCTYVDSNCINNFNEPICIITLDTTTNKCEVIWGRTNSPPSGGLGIYNVYRDSNNVYVLRHSQALNVLSEFIDSTSNPSAGPVSYELSTVDSCGESALSSPHTSIYLTTTAALNVYILNWTAYVGFTPTKYIIYRGPSLSNLKAIDSVGSNVLTFHDTLPPLGSYYVLEAVSPNGPCIPTTHRAGKASFSLLSGSFSNGFNTKTLGVNNIGNNVNNLKVYPNPSNGMVTLSYSMSGGDNVTVSVLNELGQQVYTEQKYAANGLVSEQLNLESLTSGIYILRIETSKGISLSKLSIMQR